MNTKLVIHIIVWFLAPSFQSALGQKTSGVYSGKVGNENSVLELKSSNDIILGVVFKGSYNKWFFAATSEGSGFSGNPTIGLAPEFFIRGTFKEDSVFLTIVAPDSTYIGRFKWVAKRNAEKIVSQTLDDKQSLDKRLVGEWICINSTAPSHARLINWKIEFLENGIVILDHEYIKSHVENLFAKHSVKQKVVIPKMNVTWSTSVNKLIETWNTEFEQSETIKTYEIKGDSLFITGTTSGITETLIRVQKDKKNRTD